METFYYKAIEVMLHKTIKYFIMHTFIELGNEIVPYIVSFVKS